MRLLRRGRPSVRAAVRGVELLLIAVLLGVLVGFFPVMTFSPGAAAHPPPGGRAPESRAVATTEVISSAALRGVTGVPEHLNEGAPDPSRACGPAALATVRAYWLGESPDPSHDTAALQSRYPPDVEFGLFGSSPALMTRAAAETGLHPQWGEGEASLRAWVAAGYPVIVLQDVGAAWHRTGLHWTVVYAYDDSNVYLTNWTNADGTVDVVPWTLFRSGWTDGILMTGSGVAGRFLITRP